MIARPRAALALAVVVGACARPGPGALPRGDGADAGGGDARFRATAEAVAAGLDARVAAWGTAPVAGDGAPHRFATLRARGDDDDARGGYLLEAGPGRLWLVTFADDGRTDAWPTDPGPSWHARAAATIAHGAGHHRGDEALRFALRGGAPVLVAYRYVDDVDDASDDDRDIDYRDSAGGCRRCPPLANTPRHDAALRVTGPAADAAALLR